MLRIKKYQVIYVDINGRDKNHVVKAKNTEDALDKVFDSKYQIDGIHGKVQVLRNGDFINSYSSDEIMSIVNKTDNDQFTRLN